jgi:putative FmdB family regulatory protein
MPRYEFQCECGEVYDVWAKMADKDKEVKAAKCPKCGSKSKDEIMGAPSVKFSNPVGTDRWNSESKGHDYRYKYNMDKKGGTRDQRKAAERASRVGSEPYRKIDDISGGKHFGEVK